MQRPIHALLIGALILGTSGLFAANAEKKEKDAGISASEEGPAGRWKDKLGLSDDQAQKLKAALKAERETMRPLRRELRDSILKLKDQVEDKASDKDVQASLDRVDQARKAVQAEREKFKAGLASFLQPSQRAKILLKMASRRFHRGMGFGHGGRECGGDAMGPGGQPQE